MIPSIPGHPSGSTDNILGSCKSSAQLVILGNNALVGFSMREDVLSFLQCFRRFLNWFFGWIFEGAFYSNSQEIESIH